MNKNSLHLFKIALSLTLVAWMFTSAVFSQPECTDLLKYQLKGKVRSLMETRYSLQGKGKHATKDKVLYQKLTLFNEYGFEMEVTLYKNEEIYLISKYLCGPDGKQTEMNEYNPDGTLNLNVSYVYDDKGFIIKAIYKWADIHNVGEICENTDYYYEIIRNELFTKVIYVNDYRGFCLEENYLTADSLLSFKIVNRYDFRGNKTESDYLHGNERLSWMTKYYYDRYNNVIESKVFKSNYIAVYSRYIYQFDEMGNWISRKDERDVHINILTEGLEQADMITERVIEYY